MDEQLYRQFYEVENTHWWFAARRRILIAYLLRLTRTSRRLKLLDVGCGTGAILAEASKYFDAYGVDASPLAVAFCRQRGLSHLVVGNLADLAATEKFDIITLLDVIEHIDDDRQALRLASDRLSEGGHILVTVPAYQWLWSAHDVVNHHKRRYTRKTLAAAISGAGFHVEHLTYFNSFLFPIALVRRMLARATGKEEADDFRIPAKPVNSVLDVIFGLEQYMIPHCAIPFGLSVLCSAKKVGP